MKEKTKEWIEYVERDLSAAEELLEKEYLANIVVFHCQQAVEKVLKAIIVEAGAKAPRIHNIVKLYESLAIDMQKIIPISDYEKALIDSIYSDSRYPLDIGLLPQGFPTKTRAEEIYQIAFRIVNDAKNFLDDSKS